MRNICITYNTERVINWEEFFNENDHVTFIVAGEEYGEKENRRHYQIYVEFDKQMYNKGLRNVFKVEEGESFHAENRKGNMKQASEYCMKDDKYVQYGEPKKKDRDDFEELFIKVKEGMSNYDLLIENPSNAKERNSIKFMREAIAEEKGKIRLIRMKKKYDKKLQRWQKRAIKLILNQNDREILWIYDKVGNMGKTWLGMHMKLNYDACICRNGKSNDIAHMYDYEEIVLFDFTRNIKEYINYAILEQMKDGVIMASKYESKMKYCPDVKICVFANFMPDIEAMSIDRWNIYKLKKSKSVGVIFRAYEPVCPTEI